MPTRLLLWAVLALLGCRGAMLPSTLPELQVVAAAERDQAVKARQDREPKVARKHADRALQAADAADALLAKAAPPPAKAPPADQQQADAVRAAALAAQVAAEFAREEYERADIVDGLIAKAYRGARSLALASSFHAMAAAADQAAKGRLEDLPEAVRKTALSAAQSSAQYSGRAPLPNGQPDWPGVRDDCTGMAAHPPPSIAYSLAVAFSIIGKGDLAVIEVENACTGADSAQPPCRFVRCFVYSLHSWGRLAGEEARLLADPQFGNDLGPQLASGAHVLFAVLLMKDKNYPAADRELVAAARLWPDNPITEYLTGERLAADGRTSEAAASLEKTAKGSGNEWLATKVAARAKAIRDGRNSDQALFYDPAFMTEVLLHFGAQAAKQSPAAKAVFEKLAAAREVAEHVLSKVPGQ